MNRFMLMRRAATNNKDIQFAKFAKPMIGLANMANQTVKYFMEKEYSDFYKIERLHLKSLAHS